MTPKNWTLEGKNRTITQEYPTSFMDVPFGGFQRSPSDKKHFYSCPFLYDEKFLHIYILSAYHTTKSTHLAVTHSFFFLALIPNVC